MSENYIERVENLIRVVSAIPDNKFNFGIWYNPRSGCGCGIGHAMQDAYFIARRFYSPFINLVRYGDIAAFFDISEVRTMNLFVRRSGYETRQDLLAALRVLLLEKMAQDLPECAVGEHVTFHVSMDERQLETV